MNLARMSKGEYEKFRLIINILVFAAFLLAFIFVQFRQLKYQNFVNNILAALVLSSIFLMLGIMTAIPYYSAYVGRTFMAFSALMLAGEIYRINTIGFDTFSIIELALAAALLLYGFELKSGSRKLISLKALTKN